MSDDPILPLKDAAARILSTARQFPLDLGMLRTIGQEAADALEERFPAEARRVRRALEHVATAEHSLAPALDALESELVLFVSDLDANTDPEAWMRRKEKEP